MRPVGSSIAGRLERKELLVRKKDRRPPTRTALWLASSALALAVVAFTVGAASAKVGAAAPPTTKPASAAKWKALERQAKQEGTVTIYSAYPPTNLTGLTEAFKQRFGMNAVFNRQLDTFAAALINAEVNTNKPVADIWCPASKPIVLGALKNGWVGDAVGPNFFKPPFDRKFMVGKAFTVGASPLGIGWNTKLFPQGVKDFKDFLNPALANGKIGIDDPSVGAAIVDFYNWLTAREGADYLKKLAPLKPRIYLSAVPMAQALAAGEIAAATFVLPAVQDLKAQGAPVEFAFPRGGGWNSRLFCMVLKQGPHPAAAQLLANFIVSREGQAALNPRYVSLYKGVPGTYFMPMRNQPLSALTPKKIEAFVAEWNGLFKK
jgi:iron(III) transport system substrate-binding protein